MDVILLRASSYEPGNRAGSVSGTNSVVCSYEKFQLSRLGWNSNKTKMVKHKLLSFATVVALWTLVTLLIKLIHMLLKWKYRSIHCKNYAILAAMMQKRSCFVKKVSSRSPSLECSYGKIFIHLPRSRSQKTEILDLGNWASPFDRAHMKRP